jgi:cell division protein FtsW (lipid II flippase)
MLAFALFSPQINGARQWVFLLGFIVMSTDGIVALFLPVFAGALYALRGCGWKGALQAWLLTAPVFLFCLTRPDLGAAAFLGLCCLLLLLVCACSGWFGAARGKSAAAVLLLSLLGLGLLLGLLYLWQPDAIARLAAWVQRLQNPLSDLQGSGYEQSIYWLMRQGTRWLGQGVPVAEVAAQMGLPQDVLYSADIASSASLVTLAWRYGAVWALALVAAIGVGLAVLWRTACKVRSTSGHIVSLSCAVLFTVQFGLGLLYAAGLWPAEIVLPFAGGLVSTLTLDALLAGLLLAAFRLDTVTGITSRRRTKPLTPQPLKTE